ncbi:MAG TPA: hypothetical protein VHR55_04445 [Candidatus Limnocylindria bacterium]|nr:hypothetical protein [Candidatus Limnocylindria bacterium]
MHRLIRTVLWAYFGWYLASFLLALAAAPAEPAVLGGIAMAVIASVDLRGGRRQPAGPPGPAIASAER